jgi:hypothetical protein
MLGDSGLRLTTAAIPETELLREFKNSARSISEMLLICNRSTRSQQGSRHTSHGEIQDQCVSEILSLLATGKDPEEDDCRCCAKGKQATNQGRNRTGRIPRSEPNRAISITHSVDSHYKDTRVFENMER